MIVQRVAPGEMPVIIRNVDHAETAAAFAHHFTKRLGGARSWRLMKRVTANHEAGWLPVDFKPCFNPETGLPYHLADTPMPQLLAKTAASPTFNERDHPFCGLLSSMHSWGLFHDRCGLSDKIAISARPSDSLDLIARVLADEVARQERLKADLRESPVTAPWVSHQALMTSYKLLEFFDTLALFFQLAGDGMRESDRFLNVPVDPDREGDVVVTAEIVGPAIARLTPYPFDRDPLVVRCHVRRIPRSTSQLEMLQHMKTTQYEIQEYTVTGVA